MSTSNKSNERKKKQIMIVIIYCCNKYLSRYTTVIKYNVLWRFFFLFRAYFYVEKQLNCL